MEKFNGRMCPVSIDDAETAFDYQPEVSGSSSFVYGVEQFKESLKESVPQAGGVVGGLLYKAGKEIDKYFPDGIKLFNGSVDVKIADKLKKGGEILVNAADRNVEAMQREFRRNNPRLEKAQENIMFDVGNQGANWTTMLLSGRYAGYVMGNLVLGGEFQERADKYKQEHGGSLEGFAQEYGDEAGYNLANAFVQGVEERYLGSFAQVKSIKKGMGFVKAIGKNAVQEGFIEEPLQDVTDFYFDKLTGFNENEELKDRLKGNLRGYVVASLFGGAGGFGAAVYQRAEGIDYYKEALKNTVPEKDLEKVATKAYEQDAKTLREIVTVEIENSSSLENKRGEVYENMYKSAIDSVNRARKQGGYADLRTEEEVAAYAKAESDNFANWVLEEANRRNTTIQNVLDASSIYSDETGLHIGMTNGIAPYNEVVDKVEEIIEEKTTPQETAQTEETSVSSQEENVEEVITQENQEETKGDSLAEIVSDAIEETGLAEQTKETQPVDKIEDYGEKLEGAKKDLEYNVAKKQTGNNSIERVMSKVGDNVAERIYIANWLREQDPEFVDNLAKYNHKLITVRTNAYKEQLSKLFKEHGNELNIGVTERLSILYGDQDPSRDVLKKYGITPERDVFIQEGKRYIVKATPEYVARKLGDRGKVSFQYAKSTRGGHYLWVKKGSGGWHVLESFSSKEEMEDFKNSHTEEQLEELLKEKTDVTPKEKPIRKRQGEDYRNGKNVDAKDFTEAFGFRGVQFGNYENNEKRQRELNNAYDSLMDLANILNIPPRAISLEGKLGIAFGARGSGSAAAHYEPNGKIINITRDSGAGAIGHEWFHALDNYLAGGEKFATGGQRDEMRIELRKKMVGFLSAIEMERDYQSRLALLGQYWKRKWEIGARAFEVYLVKKMEENGIVNDYLAQDRSDETPYLNKEEQEKVLPRLDEFFSTLQTEETEQGIRLYQESLDLAEENARLDDLYPAYEGETININGQEKTVYNSNGDRIAKSKEALENFYKWFGNSKVVDEQGRPLVVYHGTLDLFDAFDKERIGDRWSADERGFFFIDRENLAKRYATSDFDESRKGYIMPVYISAKKPLIIDRKYALKNGLGSKVFDREDSISFWDNYQNFVLEEVDKNKNDAVIVNDDYSRMVVAFEPNQIKSTSNRGTYSESDNIYYQFAGENAQTAALDELDRAKQLETNGVDNEEIRQQTGWFKGVDGKWRFEISDEDAKMLGTIEELLKKNEDKHEKTLKKLAKLEKERDKLRIAVNKNEITENEYYSKLEENDKKIQTLMDNDEAFKVKDIISHEKLFDAYPWIANINVFISERIDPDEAYYDERTKSITVGKNVAKEPASSINLKGIILHEIQHAIQFNEKFARGGSPDDFDSIEQLRRGLEQGKQLLDEANEALETAEDLGYSDDTDINGMPVSFYREQKEQAQKQIDYANERISNYKDPYQKYKSLYGEIEARNTAIRSEFTEELRGKISPERTQDIKNADAIVVFDDGTAMSYKPETYYQSAFAGSRVDYDRPSLEAIGSGEGHAAHGWGLYYALNKDVAEGYRKRFSDEDIYFKGKKLINTDSGNPGSDYWAYMEVKNRGFDGAKDYYKEAIEIYENSLKEWPEQREYTEKELKQYRDGLEKIESLTDEEIKEITKQTGQVHEVDIPENPYLLDEQKTFAEQSDFVKEKMVDLMLNETLKETNASKEKRNEVAKAMEKWTGGHFYQHFAVDLKSDKLASQLLEKYGIKGITYDGRQDGRCFVIFNPDDVKVIQKFYQRGKATRGSIQFKGQEAIIRLTESANASTLAHELAHYYLQNTFLYNKSGLASPEYSTYFKPIADYLGIDSNQETIKEWQQEKFARAYEQYLLKGKAETPELQAAFNNYNKWIKRAYRMLKSKPKYRNEEGKLVEPRLTPEIMEAFGKLTGGYVARPDIEAMAETVTPELENAVVEYENKVTQEQERIQKETVYPTTEIRETAEEGATGKSGVAFRVLGEELGYDVKHIEDQMEKAREFVRKNLSEAKEIVNGKQAPEGMLSSAINLAYVEVMENSGNYQEAERATRIRSMEQTRRGQEIAMEKATTDNVLNAETWSNLVLSRKSAEAARKYFKNDLKALQDFIKRESENIAKQIVNKPKEERASIIKENLERITQETGILFQEDYSDLEDSDYYNEVLNETQLMIEKGMGIGLDEDQIDYIHDNVRQLQDIVKETVSNNGNISIEAFKQIRKMYDTIESYTPSSNVAVWSSIIGRGAMLASIKSPILNIISNAENMITETLSRKALNIVTGQSNDNIVDSKIINDYLKWSYDVYQASGYMPSVTSDILGGRPILGEKRLTSQGKGKVRAIGRFAEDIVFKELMGLPDSISKDLNFVSVAGNKATQQAYKEGLSGDKAKARANELFKDAILLRPMTEEGERIRGESMAAAHEATFTQDSEISKIALRIRDVLNSKEFKAGDFLVPFVKTPANVVALGMEYSLGSIYTVYHIKDIINNPQSDVSQAAIKAGVRNGLGMILAMMLAGFVDDDDYIPEYDNASPKQRDIAKLKNAPFNSIRIGNKWINLDYFGPLAIPMAGILTARAKQDLTGFLQGVSGQALKVPGVKEINSLIGDVTRAVQYGVSYKKIAEDVFNWGVEQTASRTIPAIITDFGKLIDKYERETGGEMARRVMAKIPLLREELPIKTDITGRKIETEPTNILFGSRVKTAVDDAVVKEIDRLNKAGNAPTISDPTRYGKFRSLETEEKDKIRAKFNQEYGRKAREKISSSAYKRLDDAQKKKELNKIRKKISDDLKKQK